MLARPQIETFDGRARPWIEVFGQRWVFVPRPDMNAYQLACCLELFLIDTMIEQRRMRFATNPKEDPLHQAWSDLPESCRSYFQPERPS